MKRLLIALALLLVATTSFAWTLSWTASPGAAGYRVSYKPLAATTNTTIDTTAMSLNLDGLSLVPGTRYEFFIQGYVGEPKSYSGESDHIRFTWPLPPTVIEMQGQPINITIMP